MEENKTIFVDSDGFEYEASLYDLVTKLPPATNDEEFLRDLILEEMDQM